MKYLSIQNKSDKFSKLAQIEQKSNYNKRK